MPAPVDGLVLVPGYITSKVGRGAPGISIFISFQVSISRKCLHISNICATASVASLWFIVTVGVAGADYIVNYYY